MCAAIEAADKRLEAATLLASQLQANATAEALAAALPLDRCIPYDMAALLVRLDEKERKQ